MVSKVAPGGSRHGEKRGQRVKNCSYVSLLKTDIYCFTAVFFKAWLLRRVFKYWPVRCSLTSETQRIFCRDASTGIGSGLYGLLDSRDRRDNRSSEDIVDARLH